MPRLASALLAAATAGVAQAPVAPPDDVRGLLEQHCHDCHADGAAKGGFALDADVAGQVDALWRWSRVRERVAAAEMPPPDRDAPEAAERARIVAWVDGVLAEQVPRLGVDPGKVTVRRLSRAQWRNVVFDQLGVEAATDGIPADDLGYGFDSIGDALTFSTLHLEKYLAAAREVAAAVFHGEDPAAPARRRFEAELMRVSDEGNVRQGGDQAMLLSNATLRQTVEVPRDGVYRLRVVAAGRQAGAEPARMAVAVDGRELDVLDVPNEEPGEFELTTPLASGRRVVALSFVNDHYDPQHPDPRQRDRNLSIDVLEVEGPLDPRPVPAQQRWLHDAAQGRDDAARVAAQIAPMLRRLWRREPASDEVGRLRRAAVARLRAGESIDEVRRFVLTAALASPNFLFRVESPPRGAAAEPIGAAEYATRLSFFLWASAPDEELTARAAALRDGDGLAAEVERMLQDPRGERLATDFAAQWLELRRLDELTPDPARFPGFDAALRSALRRETELLFLAVVREGRDVRELLDCDFTHADAALARFYGLPRAAADDEAFVRVPLTGESRRRGGLLGHASMHAVTSNPTRTSPVKRGKWILENLLGQAPPPPPPGNDSLPDEQGIDSAATLRLQLAQHRESPKCAVCHVRMDVLGLALERFDAVGRPRDRDEGGPIDASGELPDGRRIDGLADLKRVLAADPAFVRTLTHKLFVYAVGRDLRPADRLRIDHGVRMLLADGRPVLLVDLVLLVARDPAFTHRAGAG